MTKMILGGLLAETGSWLVHVAFDGYNLEL